MVYHQSKQLSNKTSLIVHHFSGEYPTCLAAERVILCFIFCLQLFVTRAVVMASTLLQECIENAVGEFHLNCWNGSDFLGLRSIL